MANQSLVEDDDHEISVDDAFKQIQKLLLCNVCKKAPTQPKHTKCDHIFCKNCVKITVKAGREECECPVCKKKTTFFQSPEIELILKVLGKVKLNTVEHGMKTSKKSSGKTASPAQSKKVDRKKKKTETPLADVEKPCPTDVPSRRSLRRSAAAKTPERPAVKTPERPAAKRISKRSTPKTTTDTVSSETDDPFDKLLNENKSDSSYLKVNKKTTKRTYSKSKTSSESVRETNVPALSDDMKEHIRNWLENSENIFSRDVFTPSTITNTQDSQATSLDMPSVSQVHQAQPPPVRRNQKISPRSAHKYNLRKTKSLELAPLRRANALKRSSTGRSRDKLSTSFNIDEYFSQDHIEKAVLCRLEEDCVESMVRAICEKSQTTKSISDLKQSHSSTTPNSSSGKRSSSEKKSRYKRLKIQRKTTEELQNECLLQDEDLRTPRAQNEIKKELRATKTPNQTKNSLLDTSIRCRQTDEFYTLSQLLKIELAQVDHLKVNQTPINISIELLDTMRQLKEQLSVVIDTARCNLHDKTTQQQVEVLNMQTQTDSWPMLDAEVQTDIQPNLVNSPFKTSQSFCMAPVPLSQPKSKSPEDEKYLRGFNAAGSPVSSSKLKPTTPNISNVAIDFDKHEKDDVSSVIELTGPERQSPRSSVLSSGAQRKHFKRIRPYDDESATSDEEATAHNSKIKHVDKKAMYSAAMSENSEIDYDALMAKVLEEHADELEHNTIIKVDSTSDSELDEELQTILHNRSVLSPTKSPPREGSQCTPRSQRALSLINTPSGENALSAGLDDIIEATPEKPKPTRFRRQQVRSPSPEVILHQPTESRIRCDVENILPLSRESPVKIQINEVIMLRTADEADALQAETANNAAEASDDDMDLDESILNDRELPVIPPPPEFKDSEGMASGIVETPVISEDLTMLPLSTVKQEQSQQANINPEAVISSVESLIRQSEPESLFSEINSHIFDMHSDKSAPWAQSTPLMVDSHGDMGVKPLSNSSNITPSKDKDQLNPIQLMQKQRFTPLTVVRKPGLKTRSQATVQKSILSYIEPTNTTTSLPDAEDIENITPLKNLAAGPSRRRKTSLQETSEDETLKKSPKSFYITCSRLSKEQVVEVVGVMSQLGGNFNKDFNDSITHLIVCADDKNRVKDHTIKYLQAVASGLWIVSFQWIVKCREAGKFIAEHPYEVFDVSGVPGPKMSRTSRTLKPLLKKFRIFCAPPFFSTKKNDIDKVVSLMGAKVIQQLDDFKKRSNDIDLIITEAKVSQEFDQYQEWLLKYKVASVDIEWLSRTAGFYEPQSIRPYLLCIEDNLEACNYPSYLIAHVPDTQSEASSF